MSLLILGLLIWITVHLFPSVAPARRQRLIVRHGNLYQGLFSLLLITSLGLIIAGWRQAVPVHLYTPPAELRHPAMLLAVIGLILMVAASFRTRIKLAIRHPQLTGVLLWSIAHLLLNGDSRAVLLFGALGAWTVVSMLTINRRDGAWIKPPGPDGWLGELGIVVIGLLISALAIRFHSYLSGVPLTG